MVKLLVLRGMVVVSNRYVVLSGWSGWIGLQPVCRFIIIRVLPPQEAQDFVHQLNDVQPDEVWILPQLITTTPRDK